MSELTQHHISVKSLHVAIGLVVLIVAATVSSLTFLQTRSDAEREHGTIERSAQVERSRIADYDERGRLESQRELTMLEIRWLIKLQNLRDLTPEENEQLEFLRQKRQDIDRRLRALNANRG